MAQWINEFVDKHVWQEVLSLCLDVTELVKVNKSSIIIESLEKFVQKSFELLLNDKTQIWTLDYLTLDLLVSSHSNIVTNLNVYELLACATKKNKRYTVRLDKSANSIPPQMADLSRRPTYRKPRDRRYTFN